MKLTSNSTTHVGRRHNNEDAHVRNELLGVFAVADGMGGYEGGEVASTLAIETLIEFVRRNAGDDDVTWPYRLDHALSFGENIAVTAARLAHDQIAHRRRGPLAQMGSTLAMMLVRERGRAIVAHIGDSRVYRLRDGALEQLTVDHSMYEELRRAGTADLPPREQFAYGNVITRALGISGSADVQTVDVRPGDVYLLCTDGLSEPLSEADIARILSRWPPGEAAGELVAAAYEAGGRDNITAVVVRCEA